MNVNVTWSPRKSVKQCSQSVSIKRKASHTTMRQDLMLYPYKILVAQLLTAANKQLRCKFCWNFLQFVQQYATTLDCLWFSNEAHFHLDEFMNKHNMKFLAFKNPHRVVDTSFHLAKCTMQCAISKQARAYWTNLCGEHHNQGQLQNEVTAVIQGAGHVDTTFFQQDGAHPHTVNVVLYVLHDMSGSCSLSN